MKTKKIQQRWYCSKITLLVVLFSFCIFVVQSRLRRNPKTIFFHDKKSPSKVDKSERLVYPFLERDCKPKVGDFAYNYIFDMQSENTIVTASEHANVAPIQQILVNNHFNLKNSLDFFKCYMSLLPYFKTRTDAFGYLNNIAFKRHNSFSFLNYNSLINSLIA